MRNQLTTEKIIKIFEELGSEEIIRILSKANVEEEKLRKIEGILLDANDQNDDENAAKTLATKTRELLTRISMPASLLGYRYIQIAMKCINENNDLLYGEVVKKLYPQIAEEDGRNTIPTRVERAIRHSIEVVYERGDPKEIEAIFGYSAKGKLTNAEFLAKMAEKLDILK